MSQVAYLNQECIKQIGKVQRELEKLVVLQQSLSVMIKDNDEEKDYDFTPQELSLDQLRDPVSALCVVDPAYNDQVTVLCEKFLDHFQSKLDKVKLVTDNPQRLDHLFSRNKDNYETFNRYTSKNKYWAKNLVEYQIREIKKNGSANKVLVICEIYKSKFLNDDYIKEIIVNNRQLGINLLLIVRNAKSLSPLLRSNMDVTFITGTSNVPERKRLYDTYGGMYNYYSLFEHNLNVVSKNNGMLVCCIGKTIDESAKKITLEPKVTESDNEVEKNQNGNDEDKTDNNKEEKIDIESGINVLDSMTDSKLDQLVSQNADELV